MLIHMVALETMETMPNIVHLRVFTITTMVVFTIITPLHTSAHLRHIMVASNNGVLNYVVITPLVSDFHLVVCSL
jgi:hypothetical protein